MKASSEAEVLKVLRPLTKAECPVIVLILRGYAKINRLATTFKEDLLMKLHQTYPLTEMLDALTAASDNTREIAKQLKAEGRHMQVFTVFEAENMLSVSPHARVTLTRRENENRWTGYMETSAYADGERVPAAVNRREYALVANDDFSSFTIEM